MKFRISYFTPRQAQELSKDIESTNLRSAKRYAKKLNAVGTVQIWCYTENKAYYYKKHK